MYKTGVSIHSMHSNSHVRKIACSANRKRCSCNCKLKCLKPCWWQFLKRKATFRCAHFCALLVTKPCQASKIKGVPLHTRSCQCICVCIITCRVGVITACLCTWMPAFGSTIAPKRLVTPLVRLWSEQSQQTGRRGKKIYKIKQTTCQEAPSTEGSRTSVYHRSRR